jgi:uncharacterized protein
MYLSKYCKIYPSAEDPDSVIIFSTKNAAIVELPASMAAHLPNAKLNKKDISTLKKLGFLIDDQAEERRDMLGFIDELRALNRTLSIKVAMNLDCNLGCRYCFEGKRKGKLYMSRETADGLVDFISKKISGASNRGKKRRIGEVYLTFYGGEPLLSRDLVIYVSKKIKSLAESSGISFGFSFITNGTLLTRKTAETLKPLGLQDAYITIDGPKDIHDKSRPYKTDNGSSFEAIIKNIRTVSDVVTIQTGGNFSKNNYETFPELLDYLIDNGLPPSKAEVLGFFPVLAERADFGPAEFNDGCISLNEPWFFEAALFLREEILKRGHRLCNLSPGPCAMEFENNILVNWDGGIYKCPGMIGRTEFRVGDVRTGIHDCRQSHNRDNWKNEECLDCAYLPLCFGGCRYMRFIRDGNIDGVDCKKPYFDACLETLVKQDIKYGLTDS